MVWKGLNRPLVFAWCWLVFCWLQRERERHDEEIRKFHPSRFNMETIYYTRTFMTNLTAKVLGLVMHIIKSGKL